MFSNFFSLRSRNVLREIYGLDIILNTKPPLFEGLEPPLLFEGPLSSFWRAFWSVGWLDIKTPSSLFEDFGGVEMNCGRETN